MKKLIYFLALFCTSHLVSAQAKSEKYSIDFGAFISTKSTFENDGYSGVKKCFRIRAMYKFGQNQFHVKAGVAVNRFGKAETNYTAPIFLQTQYNFANKPKTFFTFMSYGVSPKLGENFYASTTFDLGVGWKYSPKFLKNNSVYASLNYNNNNLKKVLHTSYDYQNGTIISKTAYQKLDIDAAILSIGLSF